MTDATGVAATPHNPAATAIKFFKVLHGESPTQLSAISPNRTDPIDTKAPTTTAIEDPKRKTSEGLSHASEVRAYVRALPQEERSAFILQAIAEGDRATVASVLHAQPFLSGLSADAQRTLRQQAGAKFAPIDHAQHQAAATALEHVLDASSTLAVRYGAMSESMSLSPAEKAAEKLKALAGG